MAISIRSGAVAAALWLLGLAIGPACAQQPEAAPQQNEATNVDPARLKSAREFVKVARIEEQLSVMLPIMTRQITSAMMPQFGKQISNEKAKAEFQAFIAQLTAVIEKQFSEKQSDLLGLTAVVYARVLTVEQLDALSAFYTSAAGQKFVSATPEIMAETGPTIMDLLFDKPVEIDRNVDPARLAAARDMLQASNTEKMLDVMMAQTAEGPRPPLPADADPKALEDANRMIETVQNSFKSRRGELLDVMAMIWAKRFSVEEMQAVTAFYRTPHGEAVVNAMPALAAEQQKVSQSFYQSVFANVGTAVQEMRSKNPGSQP
jgi:hypothetical protein